MKVDGHPYRTIWLDKDRRSVRIIDQTALPFAFKTLKLSTAEQAAHAIRTMQVRGAPLIGAAAAFGMALAMAEGCTDSDIARAYAALLATRPTAVNLRWALDRMREVVSVTPPSERVQRAFSEAAAVAEEDVQICQSIGRHGMALIEAAFARNPERPVNILTHCNAGWLATVDWGTATAPIYAAHDQGIPLHVWVDETRPRNQGAFLTAWELGHHGVPHTIVADNAGGHLMQSGQVDLVLVGTDRTTATGHVCNKIGTYLKALAAHDNQVPFYVALPSSSIDWNAKEARDITIENRDADEVLTIRGRTERGRLETVYLAPDGSPAANPAFDVTPAHLVTALVTERGLCEANAEGLAGLFPDHHVEPRSGLTLVVANDA